MKSNLLNEKEKLLREIEEDRGELFLLEEDNIKKSFGKFFIKPLAFAIIVGVLLKFMNFGEDKIIGGFLIAFFALLLVFSYKAKKDFQKRAEKVNQEKIKIQADIFSKAKKLADIEKELVAD
ncbi:MAG: hypothetical protein ACTIH2_06815 [Anaerococcus sp.]